MVTEGANKTILNDLLKLWGLGILSRTALQVMFRSIAYDIPILTIDYPNLLLIDRARLKLLSMFAANAF